MENLKSVKDLTVIFGGPSGERGISLNSARSVVDHLASLPLTVSLIYIDSNKVPHQVKRDQLYSNTPLDFDFKLSEVASTMSRQDFESGLKRAGLVLPVIHGTYGEDGELQAELERCDARYAGSSAAACRQAFNKHLAKKVLSENGYAVPAWIHIVADSPDNEDTLKTFFSADSLRRVIVKPAASGSSIGVFTATTPSEAIDRIAQIHALTGSRDIIIEAFLSGIEFTLVIIQNQKGEPVSLIPIEIETDQSDGAIFDYRKKYLPTHQARYHCPPRFPMALVEVIRSEGEKLFTLLGMRDFARFDGWVLADGSILFTDFNPISGMEQNSFFFIQASQIGMSHSDFLTCILSNAARRYGLLFPLPEPAKLAQPKTPIPVICGGTTAERQVSVMSGTNSWLKLRQSDKYASELYLLEDESSVWAVPYTCALHHTAEDIATAVREYSRSSEQFSEMRKGIKARLGAPSVLYSADSGVPMKMTLDEFIKNKKFVFIGLHGGLGEDGTLQARLSENGTRHNGPDAKSSRLCMNKYETNRFVENLKDPKLSVASQKLCSTKELFSMASAQFSALWGDLRLQLKSERIICKPNADGCSAGVTLLHSAKDLETLVSFIKSGAQRIPAGSISGQESAIELPLNRPEDLLFETFIVTDDLRVEAKSIKHKRISGYIEVTIGLLGKKGAMHALTPSATVSTSHVLTVEEKFQGGTGVNLTPPPSQVISPQALTAAKQNCERLANAIGLSGYSRVDTFVNIDNGDLIVIEVNTLPALTPSTVLFQQGLAEKPALYPLQLIEKIVDLGLDVTSA